MSLSARRPGIAALALVAAMPACGHRGDPLPPLRHTPPGLAEFRFAQRGASLEASFLAPGASVDGVPYERVTVEILYAEGDKDLEKAGTRREVLAFANQRVVEMLPLPAPGTIARAAARGVRDGEKGQRTLTLALIAQPEVEAPSGLRARLVAGGVRLDWKGDEPAPVDAAVKPPSPLGFPAAPAAPVGPGAAVAARAPGAAGSPSAATPATPAAPPAVLPGGIPDSSRPEDKAQAGTAGTPSTPDGKPVTVEVRKAGFRAYRRVGTESYRLPLSLQPLADRRTTDPAAPQGTTACYVVRAVASLDPLVESAPSNEACVEVKDIDPPDAPSGLAVLPREGGLEVLWTPSAEADLAGYRVYREAPGEPRRKVADVEPGRSSWLDSSARAGVVYRYSVTAIDSGGNESPETPPAEGSLLP